MPAHSRSLPARIHNVFVRVDGVCPLLWPNTKKLWSQVGLALRLSMRLCLCQLSSAHGCGLSILNRKPTASHVRHGHPHSIFWALMADYVFMNLAMLFAAAVFEGGKLERWIRWLLPGHGAYGRHHHLGIVVDSPMIFLLEVSCPWCVIFSAATALLAVFV